jgi:hypothetical protein
MDRLPSPLVLIHPFRNAPIYRCHGRSGLPKSRLVSGGHRLVSRNEHSVGVIRSDVGDDGRVIAIRKVPMLDVHDRPSPSLQLPKEPLGEVSIENQQSVAQRNRLRRPNEFRTRVFPLDRIVYLGVRQIVIFTQSLASVGVAPQLSR